MSRQTFNSEIFHDWRCRERKLFSVKLTKNVLFVDVADDSECVVGKQEAGSGLPWLPILPIRSMQERFTGVASIRRSVRAAGIGTSASAIKTGKGRGISVRSAWHATGFGSRVRALAVACS